MKIKIKWEFKKRRIKNKIMNVEKCEYTCNLYTPLS